MNESMIKRSLFNSEHEIFRKNVARFMNEHVIPHDEKWQEQGYVDKKVWREMIKVKKTEEA